LWKNRPRCSPTAFFFSKFIQNFFHGKE
jgi:hypothetical protein